MPKSVMFRFFRSTSGMLCFFCLHCFGVHHQSLRLSRPNNFAGGHCAQIHFAVRYVACHVQVAPLLSFQGPPWCQWCSDWCALGCSAAVAFGCVCLSHISGWLRLVQVFDVVPLGVFAFCRVGSGDTLWPVRTLGHSDTSGRRVIDFSGVKKHTRQSVSTRHLPLHVALHRTQTAVRPCSDGSTTMLLSASSSC